MLAYFASCSLGAIGFDIRIKVPYFLKQYSPSADFEIVLMPYMGFSLIVTTACVCSMLSSLRRLSCFIILDTSPLDDLYCACLRSNKDLSMGN